MNFLNMTRREPLKECAVVKEVHWEGFVDVDEFAPDEDDIA